MLSCARSAYSWSFAFRAAYGMRNTVQIRAGSFGWLHIKHQNGERHGCRYQDGPVRVHEKPLIRWDFHARDSLQGLQRMVRKKQKTSSERQSCERKRRVESGSEENDPTGPGNSYKSRFLRPPWAGKHLETSQQTTTPGSSRVSQEQVLFKSSAFQCGRVRARDGLRFPSVADGRGTRRSRPLLSIINLKVCAFRVAFLPIAVVKSWSFALLQTSDLSRSTTGCFSLQTLDTPDVSSRQIARDRRFLKCSYSPTSRFKSQRSHFFLPSRLTWTYPKLWTCICTAADGERIRVGYGYLFILIQTSLKSLVVADVLHCVLLPSLSLTVMII